jgi:DNA-directed RNA polymerase subunit K
LLSLADSEMLRESLLSQAPTPIARGNAALGYTRFEKARILGARALQISLGAPILVEIPAGEVDPVAIAELEFAASMIPITVRRSHAPPS